MSSDSGSCQQRKHRDKADMIIQIPNLGLVCRRRAQRVALVALGPFYWVFPTRLRLLLFSALETKREQGLIRGMLITSFSRPPLREPEKRVQEWKSV